jgi:hypothetical protein
LNGISSGRMSPAQGDVEHRARDRQHLETVLLDHASHGRGGRGKHVRADGDREVAALPRPDAAADAVRGLEHERIEVAELPGGGQSGDAGADDDDVAFLHVGHPTDSHRARQTRWQVAHLTGTVAA